MKLGAHRLVIWLVAAFGVFVCGSAFGTLPALPPIYAYDASVNSPFPTSTTIDRTLAEHESRPRSRFTGGVSVAETGLDAAETADEALPGVAKGWAQRTADNGKGTVWQEPGAAGNANSVRVMDPNGQYPNGYVRFYNEHGQPVGLDGKPGPNSVTHIPRGPDGTYPVPKGWGP